MARKGDKETESRFRSIGELVGIYLFASTQNVPAIWHNLSVYTTSYFLFRVNIDTGGKSSWVEAVSTIAWSLAILFHQKITRSLGLRNTMVMGSVLFTVSSLLTYLSVQWSFLLLNATFAVLCGFGFGLCHAAQIVLVGLRIPSKLCGVACCGLVSGQQLVSAVINMLMTWFINAAGDPPDTEVGNLNLFSQPELLDRVPYVFILYSGISFLVSIVAFFLINIKQTVANDSNHRVESDGRMDDDINHDVKLKDDDKTTYVSESNVLHNDKKQKYISDTILCNREIHLTSGPKISEQTYLKCKENVEKQVSNTSNANGSFDCDLTPRQALKTKAFYAIFIMTACLDVAYIINGTYPKILGMTFYPEDHFFTLMSMTINISACLTNLFVGIASDKFNLKITMVALTASLAFEAAFIYLSVLTNKWSYFFWSVIFCGHTTSVYTMVSVCSIRYFGNTYSSTIYGMATAASYFTNVSMPFCIDYILSSFGFLELYTMLSILFILATISLVIGLPKVSII